jgi:hypothetical protein
MLELAVVCSSGQQDLSLPFLIPQLCLVWDTNKTKTLLGETAGGSLNVGLGHVLTHGRLWPRSHLGCYTLCLRLLTAPSTSLHPWGEKAKGPTLQKCQGPGNYWILQFPVHIFPGFPCASQSRTYSGQGHAHDRWHDPRLPFTRPLAPCLSL